MMILKQIIKQIGQGVSTLVHNMGVDFRCFHISMAEEFLKDADVDTFFQHVGGKTVTQGMTTGLFSNSGLPDGGFDCLLQSGFQHMMATLLA